MTGALAAPPAPAGRLAIADRDYLSFSAIRTYQTCPLKYFFKYIAGLPEESIRKIMGGNLARLMNVEDAVVL